MANCNCNQNPCCCELDVERGPRGFQGVPGPAPNITIGTVTTGAPGSTASAAITGTTPALVLDLTIPAGDDGAAGAAGAAGEDATELFTNLVSFFMPAPGSSSPATVGDTSWMVPGGWLYIQGAGYLYISSIISPTQVQLTNPGPAPLPGFVNGWDPNVPGNAGSGPVLSTGAINQVIQAAVPGQGEDGGTGPTGPTGPSALIPVVYSIPVAPPDPGEEFQIYTDSATTPTVITGYSYRGGAWNADVNLTPAAGTKMVNTAGDPNSTLPAGTVIGDYAWRTDVPSLWLKTGAATWVNLFSVAPTFTQVATTSGGDFGTVPVSTQRVIGFANLADTHTVAGTYTFDLQYQSVYIQADQNIDLDWSAASYSDNAFWLFQIENVDAAPINVTYAATKWSKDTAITEPATIAAGATQVFVCFGSKGTLCIDKTYVVATI